MERILRRFLNDWPFRHIWFFLTNRCNLKCDYCFYPDRGTPQTIEMQQAVLLLENMPKIKKYDFVISGGEPLICWPLTKELILYIRKNFKNANLTLQTNLLLLNRRILECLKKNSVAVEPGFDGDFLTNARHRIGMSERNYALCLRNIRMIISHKLRMNPTMTVHPDEAGRMLENFARMVSLGLYNIDVHPAFLAPWNANTSKIFLRQYAKICDYEKRSGRRLVCREYSHAEGTASDLVIQPDGTILPNWTYLSFSQKLRKQFVLLKLTNRNILSRSDFLVKYGKKIKHFFKTKRTYREFSNFNAELVLCKTKDKDILKKYLIYNDLCGRIQKLDANFFSK